MKLDEISVAGQDHPWRLADAGMQGHTAGVEARGKWRCMARRSQQRCGSCMDQE